MAKAVADRYKPNSDWWLAKGILDYGIRYYGAINEPSNAGMGNWYNLDQYYEAMDGFGDGIHASDPSLIVTTGGIMNFTLVPSAGNAHFNRIVPLINDGTIDAFNLHSYYNDRPFNQDGNNVFFNDVYEKTDFRLGGLWNGFDAGDVA